MRILELFKTITEIPRCSFHTEKMQAFLAGFGREHGYRVFEDKAGNVLCRKEPSAVCLQAHYDMVCLEENQRTEVVEEGGFLRSNGTTLGADNGMGVAAMLALMEKEIPAEFLFTNDEEVGLLGANGLEVPVTAKKLLNLDSEELGEVCIGCAGGVDIFGSFVPRFAPVSGGTLVELETVELPGGHSGIHIHQEVPNAIKVLAEYLEKVGGMLVEFRGGERVNAIPRKAYAKMVVEDPERLEKDEQILVRVGAVPAGQGLANGKELLALLTRLHHGVLAWNNTYGIPDQSINLALVEPGEGKYTITLSGRAMSGEGLKTVEKGTLLLLEQNGCTVRTTGKYPAWKPVESAFAREVLSICREALGEAHFSVIHAGLECAVINDVLNGIDAASIGPDIFDPHTGRERVDVASVEKFFNIVERIVERG